MTYLKKELFYAFCIASILTATANASLSDAKKLANDYKTATLNGQTAAKSKLNAEWKSKFSKYGSITAPTFNSEPEDSSDEDGGGEQPDNTRNAGTVETELVAVEQAYDAALTAAKNGGNQEVVKRLGALKSR
jgi:hypothetical protein